MSSAYKCCGRHVAVVRSLVETNNGSGFTWATSSMTEDHGKGLLICISAWSYYNYEQLNTLGGYLLEFGLKNGNGLRPL